jgi:small-conductance mechanosensitive channel
MTESFNIVLGSLNQVWVQMLIFIPKIILAIIIWVVGKYLINLGVALVRKIDIKGTKIDDYLIGVFSKVVLVAGKFLLFLVVLDFLGVGRTIIGAVASGLTLMVAIALGLAFGKALEEDAKEIVQQFKKHLGKKQ